MIIDYIIFSLAQSFLRAQGVCLLFFTNNDLFPFLARSFFRIQGLGRIQNGAVLLYREYLNLGRKRSSRKKNPLKKTKPKQTQNKPKRTQFFGGFWRKNFNFSLKMRIFDKFYKTFLCKTNPICASPAPKYLVLGLFENLISV